MDTPLVLSHLEILDRGPLSGHFVANAWSTLGQACLAIQDLPYGYNPEPRDATAVFRDGYGTCTTKHAAVTACAAELGYPVTKALGVYLADATVIPGLGPVLRELGLSLAPALHCFLQYGNYRIDLTEGNCNGKATTLDTYITIEACAPLPDKTFEEALLLRAIVKLGEWARLGLLRHVVPGLTSTEAQRWTDKALLMQARQAVSNHLIHLVSCARH